MKPKTPVFVGALILAAAAACGGSTQSSQADSNAGGAGNQPLGTTLPCEVVAVLAQCIGCHSDPPTKGTPGSLTSYAALLSPSTTDPQKSRAMVAIERMKNTKSPMPPSPNAPVPAEQIAAFEAWVLAGAPQGTCATGTGGAGGAPINPYDTPETCTSETTWKGGNQESPFMRPGHACIDCHTKSPKAPKLTLSGTVYPSAHEPDDCNGTAVTGAVVEVVDANGKVVTMKVNAVGNFYSNASFVPPYTAKVTYDGKERVMVKAQTSGDCNSCHTLTGTMDAPGRIVLP